MLGATVWQSWPAFRISVSSWRTGDEHVERLIDSLADLRKARRDANHANRRLRDANLHDARRDAD